MNSRNPTSWFKRLLDLTGGYYILLIVALAQFSTYIFTIPVSLFIAVSAEFSLEDFSRLWSVTMIGMTLALGILLVHIFLSTRQAFIQLQILVKGNTTSGNEEQESRAWAQISSLPWLYARVATLLSILVAFLPMLIYEALVLKLPTDQVIYTAIGVFISSLSIVTLGMIALEGMITPARQILLPRNHKLKTPAQAQYHHPYSNCHWHPPGGTHWLPFHIACTTIAI
jgi:hypothetical protein